MKLRTNESGLGHIVVIAVLAVGLVIGLAGWRVLGQQNKTTEAPEQASQASTTQTAEADIQLQNLGVDLNNVDVTTQAVREFESNGLKGFYVFGDSLSGGRTNPNFEFAALKTGTKLISSIDGIVAFIKEQPDSKDYEVFIQPRDGSIWTVGYDHVVNVAVTKGSTVKAGDVIGEPAMQNNGLTRFEIQINKDQAGATTHYCPMILLATSVKDVISAELKSMQDNWETTTKLELYDTASQNPVGCLKNTMTPAEAEGR